MWLLLGLAEGGAGGGRCLQQAAGEGCSLEVPLTVQLWGCEAWKGHAACPELLANGSQRHSLLVFGYPPVL